MSLIGCTAFHIAAWLSDMSHRGSSVPSECFAALVWAAGVFELHLWINDPSVRMEAKGPEDRLPSEAGFMPSIGSNYIA